jgi:nitrogen fixation protein FixH
VQRADARPVENDSAKVELSREARQVRDRQADITRLQIAASAVEEFNRDAREIERMTAQARQSRIEDAQQTSDRFNQRIREARARIEEARFNGEPVFNGREIRVKTSDGEETVQVPDGSREMDAYEREVRSAASENRSADTSRTTESLEKFHSQANKLRKRIETEVRADIEKAVRESSSTRLHDAAQAEEAIRQARADRPQQRPAGMEQIAQRAVDLLQ